MSDTVMGSANGGWSEKSWLQAANPRSPSSATLAGRPRPMRRDADTA
jgi:hypothetical protein